MDDITNSESTPSYTAGIVIAAIVLLALIELGFAGVK